MITDIAGVDDVKQQVWRQATRAQTQSIASPHGNLATESQS